jgi:opacity protein-like surface antigen
MRIRARLLIVTSLLALAPALAVAQPAAPADPPPTRDATTAAPAPATRPAPAPVPAPTTRPAPWSVRRAPVEPPPPPPDDDADVDSRRPEAALGRRLTVPPPSTRRWAVRLSGHTVSVLSRHRSLDPLKSDDHLLAGGVTLGAELQVVRTLLVGLELGYSGGSFSDVVFGSQGTAVRMDTVEAGVRVGYRLWGALTPFVRAGFAGTWTEAHVRAGTGSLGGTDFAPGGYALAGLELTVRRDWLRRTLRTDAFTMGITFEAGYVHLGRFGFDGGVSQTGLLDEQRSGLGDLTLGGPAIRVGFLLAF